MKEYRIVNSDGREVKEAGVFIDHEEAKRYAEALAVVNSRKMELGCGGQKNTVNYWIETKE